MHPTNRKQTASARFTASRIPSLPAGTYTDPGQPGLQIRVREKAGGGASRTWLLRFKFKGEETRILLGHFPQTTLDAARGEARRLRELADQGIDPRRARPRRRDRTSPIALSSAPAGASARHTIEYLASEFVERYVRPSRKRPEYAEAILKRDVLTTWKGRDARTIDPADVIDLLDRIVDRGAPIQANRTAALLGQMFKFGIHRKIVSSTPVQLLFRPGGKEKPRARTLSDVEIAAFLTDPIGCTRFPRLAHVIAVLLLTGQRRGELALARWRDIDLEAGTWNIPDENSKSGRGHICPLSSQAIEEFRALKRLAGRSLWVLPNDAGDGPLDPKLLTRGVAKCQKRFLNRGVKPFTLHDLRRTCRTGLARVKVEPHIAERVLNHAKDKIPGTYDLHQYLDEKRAALTSWSTFVAGLRA
jgi:integrase